MSAKKQLGELENKMKQRRKYRPQSRKRAAPPYVNTFLGWNYVQINLPFVFFGKWGYTGKYSGIEKRAESSSKAAPGIMVPIMACPLFFPWYFEQFLHWFFRPWHGKFYDGDGHTETYWLPAVLIVWGIYFNINVLYIELLYRCDISPVGAEWIYKFCWALILEVWNQF